MDQNPSDFSVQKQAIAKELFDLMVRSLEEDKITVEESTKASSFIADRLEQSQDIYYLRASIERLVSQWPCFSPALLSFKDMDAASQDQSKIEEVKKQLEELKSQTT